MGADSTPMLGLAKSGYALMLYENMKTISRFFTLEIDLAILSTSLSSLLENSPVPLPAPEYDKFFQKSSV
jgi:hypothetical protein